MTTIIRLVALGLVMIVLLALYNSDPTFIGAILSCIVIGCGVLFLILTWDNTFRLTDVIIITSCVGITSILANFLYYYDKSIIVFAVAISSLLILIVIQFASVATYFYWRKESFWWAAPPLLNALFLILIILDPTFVNQWNNLQFQRQIGKYNQIVDLVKSKAIGNNLSTDLIDMGSIANLPYHVTEIKAESRPDGKVIVAFRISSGGRGFHGYVYKEFEDGDIFVAPELRNKYRYQIKKINGNWYQFSDI